MNNQEEFTTRSNKLKVHRVNLQTISSSPFRISTQIFSFLFQFLFLFAFLIFGIFLKKLKIYIVIHSWLCGRVNDKKHFTRVISGNKGDFFLALDKKTKYIAIILPPKWLVCKFSNKSNKILALGLICLILGSGFWFLVLVITLSILICALHAATLCFLICTIQLMCRTFFR